MNYQQQIRVSTEPPLFCPKNFPKDSFCAVAGDCIGEIFVQAYGKSAGRSPLPVFLNDCFHFFFVSFYPEQSQVSADCALSPRQEPLNLPISRNSFFRVETKLRDDNALFFYERAGSFFRQDFSSWLGNHAPFFFGVDGAGKFFSA